MIGKLNPAEIEQLLRQHVIGRVGCHADGLTYVFPVSYAYENGTIYCHVFEGLKMNIMRKNPEVCFEVDDTKDLANWKSVIAWGTFEELTTATQREKAVKVLNERRLPLVSSETMHLGSYWPFTSQEDTPEGILFQIRLTEKTGRFERSGNGSAFVS
jgi:nitroimidazol reductase NimA-like FMN-containing flavoprotein (pyridoxamine 5'-phosphate oxidase superfamily)